MTEADHPDSLVQPMTESEWLSSDDPALLIIAVHAQASDRKLRLFSCACCRRIWPQVAHTLHQNGVETAERFADGLVNEGKRARTYTKLTGTVVSQTAQWVYAVCECLQKNLVNAAPGLGRHAAWAAASGKYGKSPTTIDFTGKPPRVEEERAKQAALVRDIFCNPFRPVVFDPAWRTSNVIDLARTIYDERAFERLPILADALMDAGCCDGQILEHCRNDGPHVRGCWVVDLAVAKQ